eukprot:6171983-Pleurochrysis_carterae.AAC.1
MFVCCGMMGYDKARRGGRRRWRERARRTLGGARGWQCKRSSLESLAQRLGSTEPSRKTRALLGLYGRTSALRPFLAVVQRCASDIAKSRESLELCGTAAAPKRLCQRILRNPSHMCSASAPFIDKDVVVDGLLARPELNGTVGKALDFDDSKGRYVVLVGGNRMALLAKNL